MSLNNSQAIAVNVVLSFLGIGDGLVDRAPVDPEVLQAALSNLADSAHKQLHAGPTSTHVEAGMSKVLGRAAGQDSDGLAQAVCRGIDSHLAHNGSLPWPSIRRPFDEWKAAHEAATAWNRSGAVWRCAGFGHLHPQTTRSEAATGFSVRSAPSFFSLAANDTAGSTGVWS